MRKLTATLCLTFAVLLGNAGVSWSTEKFKLPSPAQQKLLQQKLAKSIARTQAEKFLRGVNQHLGYNQNPDGKKILISIGDGESIAEALCSAVSQSAKTVSQRIDPKVLERMNDLLQSGRKKMAFNSSAPTPTLSARMRILMGLGQTFKGSTRSVSEETFASKYRIQSVEYYTGTSDLDALVKGLPDSVFISEVSIKSLKESLTCFSFDSQTGGYEFNYEFKSEGMSFTKFLEEFKKAGYMKLFWKFKVEELTPGFAIIFYSKSSSWQN